MAMHDEFERIHWLKARYELDGAPAGAICLLYTSDAADDLYTV